MFNFFQCFTSWLSRMVWRIWNKINSFSFLCFLFFGFDSFSPYFLLLLCGLLVLGEVFVCFLIFSISFLVDPFLNNLGMLYHPSFAFLCISVVEVYQVSLQFNRKTEENIYEQLFCQDFQQSKTTFDMKHNEVYLYLHFHVKLVNQMKMY